MKGLFYCQYVIGVGHLFRSLAICKSLVNHFDIVFLQGGKEMNLNVDSPRFHKIALPPLSAHEHNAVLYDPLGLNSVEEVFYNRRKLIRKALEDNYDFVITEYFPFGRHGFMKEILEIIELAKKRNPDCLITCSVRDVTGGGSHKPESLIIKLLRRYYNAVLVHSDPDIIPFDASFSKASEISDMLIYTGFVSQPFSYAPVTPRKKRIVVSLGSYQIGEKFVHQLVKIVDLFSDYEFLYILKHNTKPLIIQTLEKAALTFGNIRITPFLGNFQEVLSESSLCITLGGYNSLIDLAMTKTPGIAYCYTRGGNQEQFIRAQKFAQKNLVRLISAEDFAPHRMQKIINEVLAAPYPNVSIDLNGADHTARELENLLKIDKKKIQQEDA